MDDKNAVFSQILSSKGFPKFEPQHLRLLHQLFSGMPLSVYDLQNMLESQPEISYAVVNIANLPVFSAGRRVHTVNNVILMLGVETVSNIVFQQILLLYFPPKRLPGQHFDIAVFWKHIIAVSLCADMIGELCGHEDPFRLFSYGLLHDIGVIVIDACLPDKMDEIEKKVLAGLSNFAAEKLVLSGMTHTNVGEWICKLWGMGPDIANITRYHHTPREAPEPTKDLYILSISEIMGDRYYADIMGIKTLFFPYDALIMEKVGITQKQLEEIADQIPELVEQFRVHLIM